MPEEIGERLSRVEAILQEIKRSIDLTNKRIDNLRNDISENRAEILGLRAEIRDEIGGLRGEVSDIRGRLWWVIGIMIGILIPMWVTIILAILLK